MPSCAVPRHSTAYEAISRALSSKCERNYRFLNDADGLLQAPFWPRGGGTFCVCVSRLDRFAPHHHDHTTPCPRCPSHMASWKKRDIFLFLPVSPAEPIRRHTNTVWVQVRLESSRETTKPSQLAAAFSFYSEIAFPSFFPLCLPR